MTGATVAAAGVKQRRLHDLLVRLFVDVARLGYGDTPDLEYVDRSAAQQLLSVYAAYRRDGTTVEADFGESAAARATWTDSGGAVTEATITDRSILVAADGVRTIAPPSSWRLRITVDPAVRTITKLSIEAIS